MDLRVVSISAAFAVINAGWVSLVVEWLADKHNHCSFKGHGGGCIG